MSNIPELQNTIRYLSAEERPQVVVRVHHVAVEHLPGLEDVLLWRRQPLEERVEGLELGGGEGAEGADGDGVPVGRRVPDEEGDWFLVTSGVVNFIVILGGAFCVEQVGDKDIWGS